MKPYMVQRINKPRSNLGPNDKSLANFYRDPVMVDWYACPPYVQPNELKEKNKQLRKQFSNEFSSLNNVIPLDYMGSAEFECGEVPKSLAAMSNRSEHFVSVKTWLEGFPSTYYPELRPLLTKCQSTLFGWCLKDDMVDLGKFVNDELAGKGPHLKEVSQIQEGCFGVARYLKGASRLSSSVDQLATEWSVVPSGICAWLDLSLEHPWFLSRDEQQAKDLAFMLGVNYSNPIAL
jgi:hypothetical protein